MKECYQQHMLSYNNTCVFNKLYFDSTFHPKNPNGQTQEQKPQHVFTPLKSFVIINNIL